MRYLAYISITIILLLTGCTEQSASDRLLDKVEMLIEVHPDSAIIILDSLHSNKHLEDHSFARFCMLSGKITDKGGTSLPSEDFMKAYEWYSKHGSPTEQVQILIYLGCSYLHNGEFDKAMETYVMGDKIALNNKLFNQAGYIASYMGDLYEMKDLLVQAIEKYKEAAEYFKKAQNVKSYIYALRDMGRDYALTGLFSDALEIIAEADSVSNQLNDNDVKGSIANSLGNIYLMSNQYDKAEECFLKASELNTDKIVNYIALIKLYIQNGNLDKAHNILKQLPADNSEYSYPIKEFYYQIYKAKGNYKQALENLEACSMLLDSIIYAENQSKIFEIETKYNNIKIKAENSELKIVQQRYVIFSVICLCIALLSTLGYFFHRRKTMNRIREQEIDLSQTKYRLTEMSLELEKKKNQLIVAKERHENENKLLEEVDSLIRKYHNLQINILRNSSLYKKLVKLAERNIPRNNKPLITDELWKSMNEQIITIYPNLKSYILSLCPDLTDQEWFYCCFYMYGFDGKDEAKLLNLTPNSVRTKHVRFRQRLNVTLPPKTTLYEFIINNLD